MLQKKQQERNTPRTSNAPQTEEQVKFATQWNAGSFSEGTYSQPPPQPSTSKAMPAPQMAAHLDDREFQNDCYEDNVASSFGSSQRYPDAVSASQIDNITQSNTFDCVNPRYPNRKGLITNLGAKDQSDPSSKSYDYANNPESSFSSSQGYPDTVSTSQIDNVTQPSTFDCANPRSQNRNRQGLFSGIGAEDQPSKSYDFTDRQSHYRNIFAKGTIPGLDKPKETSENSLRPSGTAVVDLDQEEAAQEPEVEYTPPKDAPPIPAFKSIVPKRELIPIDNILDVPGRNTRPGW